MTAAMLRWKPIFAAAAAAALVAILGATATDLGPWYQNLTKPWWQPPDWLFGPAWTLIFTLTAIAGIIAWDSARDRAEREWIVAAFALNGFLNVLWSMLFFRLKRPDWSVVEVAALWLSIALMILVVSRSNKIASWLLLPYLAWVTFAGILNLAVVRLN
jgi:tryptophan-rich sensory protein